MHVKKAEMKKIIKQKLKKKNGGIKFFVLIVLHNTFFIFNLYFSIYFLIHILKIFMLRNIYKIELKWTLSRKKWKKLINEKLKKKKMK